MDDRVAVTERELIEEGLKGLEHIVQFTPAYDRRNSDDGKDYGVHGVELRMVCKGPLGATQFVVYTNWHLPHVQSELDARPDRDPRLRHMSCHPMPADLGYHSPEPMYDGQEPIRPKKIVKTGEGFADIKLENTTDDIPPCEYLDGQPCYYDGSGLNAERIYDVLLKEGSDGVWRELEAYYAELFLGAAPSPLWQRVLS